MATATVCALMGFELRCLHGHRGHAAPGTECVSHATAGRGSSRGGVRLAHFERCHQRGDARLGHERPHHALPVGSVLGAHPYPTMVRDFHRVIGREARAQILKMAGKLPTAIIACVGGGSNSIGIFYDFIKDKKVKLIGVEPAGAANNSAITLRVFAEAVLACCRELIPTFFRIERGANCADAFSFGGVGLSLDRAGACMVERQRPSRVRPGLRRGSIRSDDCAGSNRRDYPGARISSCGRGGAQACTKDEEVGDSSCQRFGTRRQRCWNYAGEFRSRLIA